MAKRGGFPGGGMPGNMANLMKQAQKMQRQMEEQAKELESKEFTATAGGGAVEVTVSGTREVTKVKSDEVVELPLDALIVSFGFSTNNKNLRNWNVDFKRSSVTVNAQFETSQEGVYAIGDAAEYEGKIDLIAVGMGEAPIAINQAIQYIDPDGKNRPVHSTSLIEE